MPDLRGTEPGRPARLLVVVARPGEAERAIGGSVARWVLEGTTAQLVCGTSGDAGGDIADVDPLELAATREAAQRAAAAIIGYEAVTFLHRPEGALVNDLAVREELVRLIRRFRPDTVATADPRVLITQDGGIASVDRRELGVAVLDAIDAAARPMMFAAQVRSGDLLPHAVGRVLLFWSERATTSVAIGAGAATKAAAIEAHQEGPAGAIAAEEAFAVVELPARR